MHRQLLYAFAFFHLCVGLSIVVFNGPFYGDAQNFYGYAEVMRSSNAFFDFVDISSTYNFNVFFVSILYGSAFQSVAVNSLGLLFFVYFVLSRVKLLAQKFQISNISRLNLYFASFFVVLCPSTIVRFGEPSREYMLSLLLFVVGYTFYSNRLKLFWFALFSAILIRPVSAPIYILWLSFFWTSNKSNAVKFFFVILFFIICAVLPELPIVQLYYDKNSAYDGILLDSGNFAYKIVLNLLGDVNSFSTDRYPLFYRIVFFLDYVWRLFFVGFLLSRYRMLALLFILFASLIISVVYPFPHPRYFVPSLFFLAGIASGKSVFQPFSETKPSLSPIKG